MSAPPAESQPLHLFQAYGVELEYMIVDQESLDVRPLADAILRDPAGEVVGDLDWGSISLSNELCAHLIEFKTNGPTQSLVGLGPRFQAALRRADRILSRRGARLLGGGMHPWMDPTREKVLWPYEYGEVYGAFDRIFDCRGHGWANLQSCHLNLPFADDDEFARLHAAIRLALPILPALTAASPFVDGERAAAFDQRLFTYRSNARRVPSVSGRVVPENADSQATYHRDILEPIWHDMAPLDPDGVLRHEWINARGAIARFDRMAIEIRVLDCQEHPGADVAILAAVSGLVRGLVDARPPFADIDGQRAVPLGDLTATLWRVARAGSGARVTSARLLRALGLSARARTAAEVWRELLPRVLPPETPAHAEFWPTLELLLARGTLAERIARAAGGNPSRPTLRAIYARLADCLAHGEPFVS